MSEYQIEERSTGIWTVKCDGRTIAYDEPSIDDALYVIQSRRYRGPVKVIEADGYRYDYRL